MEANNRPVTYDELCLIDPDAEAALFNHAMDRTRSMSDPAHALGWVMNRLTKRFKNHEIYCYAQDAWDGQFWYQTHKAKGEYYKKFELKKEHLDMDQVDCESGLADAAIREYAAKKDHDRASEVLECCMNKDYAVLPPQEAKTHRILREEMTNMLIEFHENPRRKLNAVLVEALTRNGMAKSTAQIRVSAYVACCDSICIADDDVTQQIEPSPGGSCPSNTENEQQE